MSSEGFCGVQVIFFTLVELYPFPLGVENHLWVYYMKGDKWILVEKIDWCLKDSELKSSKWRMLRIQRWYTLMRGNFFFHKNCIWLTFDVFLCIISHSSQTDIKKLCEYMSFISILLNTDYCESVPEFVEKKFYTDSSLV